MRGRHSFQFGDPLLLPQIHTMRAKLERAEEESETTKEELNHSKENYEKVHMVRRSPHLSPPLLVRQGDVEPPTSLSISTQGKLRKAQHQHAAGDPQRRTRNTRIRRTTLSKMHGAGICRSHQPRCGYSCIWWLI